MGPGGSKPGGAVEADKGEALLNEDAAFGGEDGVRDGPRAGEVHVHPHDRLVPLAGRVLADGRADDARAEQRLGPRRALVAEDEVAFYAVMNSLWSDYGATIQRRGMDSTDLWADLARDWLCDEDARRDKAASYYADIVAH